MQHQLLNKHRTAISKPSNASVIYGRLCSLKPFYRTHYGRISYGRMLTDGKNSSFMYWLVHVFISYYCINPPNLCGHGVQRALKPLKNTVFRKIAKFCIITQLNIVPICTDGYLPIMLAPFLLNFPTPRKWTILQKFNNISGLE